MACATSVYHTYCLGHWDDENEGTKTSNETVDHFSFFRLYPFMTSE